ncbi:MAG: family 78 glycoside hydrolase catalytic domain [Kiritimatiellae bacterium]|nr:family 78 glycoside hydrolase catalytic domain [Kiritimatiellia bacterium]
MKRLTAFAVSAGCLAGGLFAGDSGASASPAAALDASAWKCSKWISAADAPVFEGKVGGQERAADGTSWFSQTLTNSAEVASARWMTAGLGVYELYVNGRAVGSDFLKPGFTHNRKTKYAFTYDVTPLFRKGAGEANTLSAEVSAGWWRDKIATPAGSAGFAGRKGAFRGVLELTFVDGARRLHGTGVADWRAGTAGAVAHAAIFDGEEYDARVPQPVFGEGLGAAEENAEFRGEILPTAGAEVCLRDDLALRPVAAYCWRGRTGSNCDWTEPVVKEDRNSGKVFGTVVRTREFAPCGKMLVSPGETLVVDFGQNCAAVPRFRFRAACGTVLTALPGEMLNDGNGEAARGNDGPAGSIYRENLRCPRQGMRVAYTFAGGGMEAYHPRFTFFGYRYLSVTATEEVEIESVESVPVSSIAKAMETGRIETGDASVNRLVANAYWGQLSNYLSVPTDCPQRNERLGWTADTQVFCETASFNADTRRFFRKWMRDMRDTQDAGGGFPGVAPFAQYGSDVAMRFGWADAGIVVPYSIWRHFGDAGIVRENWAAMERYMRRAAETRYEHGAIARECRNYQWADWLSFEKYESAGGAGRPENSAFEKGPGGRRVPKKEALLYWDYLGACYWLWDARMMATMSAAAGGDAARYAKMAADARASLRERFFAAPDGMILPAFRDMQTPALFALKLGLVEGTAREKTKAALRRNVAARNGCLQTGFLGTSILMDTLSENGMSDLAYDILLNHAFPGWLYSVDQGATTVWERWNSYTKKDGFGPVGMNSFNHYAYGCVVAWLYRTAAGIAPDASDPGFRTISMRPVPDRRLGYVRAEYASAAGKIRSAWRYEGGKWIWDFTVPEGARARVTLPGETAAKTYEAGTYHVERRAE